MKKLFYPSMKRSLLLLFISLLTGVSIQAQRSIPASNSFIDYRPVGETRVWSFLMKDSTIGQLISTVEKEIKINGEAGYSLNNRIYLNYGKIGDSLVLDISGKHFIGNEGAYLGDDLKFIVNSQEERLKFEKDGLEISGYITRSGKKNDFAIPCPEGRFAIDNNFMDHYEAYLAMKDLKVGVSFRDSIFMPQSALMGVIEGEVVDFSWQQLHKTLFDSVFVIKLTSPQEMEMFFTADKRLLKTNIHSQNMRIYLDAVQQRPKSKTQDISFTLNSFIRLLPTYGIFILIGLLSVSIFTAKQIICRISLISFCTGVISVLIVIWIQFPLQNYLFRIIYAPLLANGQASYFKGLLTILPAGIIQEGLKIIGIILLLTIMKCKKDNSILIGSMFGTGLGIAVAFYLVSLMPPVGIFNWSILERVSWILFHTVSGALFGWAYYNGKSKIVFIVIATIFVNVFLQSLPFISQNNPVSIPLIVILNSVIVLVFLLVVLLLIKKKTYQQ